jgi:photosystem II stability/assembly factor-like uncharacterized protein
MATRLIDCYFSHPDSGFVVGGIGPYDTSKPLVLATTDGGTTWVVRHVGSGTAAGWGWKIVFPTPSTGFVSVEPGGSLIHRQVLKSVDGGQSWTELPYPGPYEQGIGFATETLGWVGGSGSNAYQTTDGGQSWVRADFGQQVNSFHMLGPDIGYAAGRYVYKYARRTPVTANTMTEAKHRWR